MWQKRIDFENIGIGTFNNKKANVYIIVEQYVVFERKQCDHYL